MAELNLGKIGIVNKGVWETGTYKKLELAKKGVITYICDADETSGEPPHADWSVFVQDGEDGLNGAGLYIITPTIDSPANGAIDTDVAIVLVGSTYETYETYVGEHTNSIAEFSETSDFATIVATSTDGLESITASGLEASTEYYARIKYISGDFSSEWSDAVSFTTKDAGITAPTVETPADGADEQGKNIEIELSAYDAFGQDEDHKSTSIQVSDVSDFSSIITETVDDEVNLTSWTSGDLEVSTTYYIRARYKSASYDSGFGASISVTTKDTFEYYIGDAGSQGFAIAPCYGDFDSLGLEELTGTNDIDSDEYGNYKQTDGESIMCHIPKFFYRVGDAGSPNHDDYGDNALDIVGTNIYADEAAANDDGYKMPRAFIDGGNEKTGVFVDKYICSKDAGDANKCASIFGGVPLSLTTNDDYTRTDGMTDCTGILADAVPLGKARGAGYSNNSTFVWGMLGILQVAHAQSSTDDTNCAWYDDGDTINYPKGCNDSLADTDDAAVTYDTAGDAGTADKPKAGATAEFARTTHNGQANGIADLNGTLHEVPMGITNFGDDATDTDAIATDDIYILKPSVALTDLTGGWDGTNDVWRSDAKMSDLYDSFTSPHALGSDTGWVYTGNGANAVFADDERIVGFVPKDNDSTNDTGTNQFGTDGLYRYNRSNMAVLCGGRWNNASGAGVFYRSFSSYRSNDYGYNGFRCLAYIQ